MASQQATNESSSPTAEVVGNAFVLQYYLILHQSPELVYRFYQDTSKLGRPEAEGLMSSITTMKAINEKIISLNYGGCTAEIKTVDAQESLGGGVIVLVTGYLTAKDNVRRNFTQSFFLATQDKGYFVLNDIFRFTEDVEYHEGNRGLINGTVASMTPEQNLAPAQEQQVSEQTPLMSEDEGNAAEVYNPSDNDGSVVEEAPVAPEEKVVDEIENGPQMVADASSTITIQEEVPKMSYASIVKVMKENAAPMSVPAPPVRSAPSNPERQAAPPPVPSPTLEAPALNLNNIDGESKPEAEVDGYSIYIKNLPLNATSAQLEEEFKRFGPIKSDGVQVRSNKQQGFCFGFVEFEVASAVQSAIEAAPILIGGRQAYVEEKRPGSRVGNRGRFPSGRGSGFRTDGQRGRGGNYGNARNYGRGDFNNRTDFANRGSGRGPFSSRGGDGGYQRVDHMGSNGARMNRPSGPAVNAAAKTVAPRVSASA